MQNLNVIFSLSLHGILHWPYHKQFRNYMTIFQQLVIDIYNYTHTTKINKKIN